MPAAARRRALLALSATVLALASGGLAQASAVPGWHVQTVISPGTGNEGILIDVVADAPSDAWAVGLTGPATGTTSTPLIARWNGTSWAQVALPAPILSALSADPLAQAVSAGSPKNVWIFGLTSTWVHYDGATWTSGHLATPGPKREIITTSTIALSKSDVWALGARLTAAGTRAYAAHFDGAKWTATPVPGSGPISAVSAVRAGDLWALQGGGLIFAAGRPGASLAGLASAAARPAAASPVGGGLVHWSGGAWHAVSLPSALRNAALSSVVASSDSNIWVGGAVRNAKKGTTEAVGHWNGHAWTVTMLPAATSAQKFGVTGLTSDGSGGLWAVANCLSCRSYVATRIWHEHSGMWQRAAMTAKVPFVILSLAQAPGGTSVWGVGAVKVGKAANALVALDGTAPR